MVPRCGLSHDFTRAVTGLWARACFGAWRVSEREHVALALASGSASALAPRRKLWRCGWPGRLTGREREICAPRAPALSPGPQAALPDVGGATLPLLPAFWCRARGPPLRPQPWALRACAAAQRRAGAGAGRRGGGRTKGNGRACFCVSALVGVWVCVPCVIVRCFEVGLSLAAGWRSLCLSPPGVAASCRRLLPRESWWRARLYWCGADGGGAGLVWIGATACAGLKCLSYVFGARALHGRTIIHGVGRRAYVQWRA